MNKAKSSVSIWNPIGWDVLERQAALAGMCVASGGGNNLLILNKATMHHSFITILLELSVKYSFGIKQQIQTTSTTTKYQLLYEHCKKL